MGAQEARLTSGPYRCQRCGNRTRFDVEETLRRRQFQHFSLDGEMVVEEEEILDRRVDRVVCRWCDRPVQ